MLRALRQHPEASIRAPPLPRKRMFAPLIALHTPAQELRVRAMKHKPLILYADDNVNILEAWKELLTQTGYDVITAMDGKEAVQAFRSHAIDLVLLDYHMPQMNGTAAAAHMKACKTDVPIALLSADDVISMSSSDAVDVFVSKSEPIPRVLEIVDDLLSRRVLFQPLSHGARGEKAA